MAKTKKTTQKEKTEVTPQTLEIEKEAPVVMEDATSPNTAVIDETPTAEANKETVMDETIVTTEIVTPVTEEPTPENPEEEILETTEEEETPEDKQEEEPISESPEEEEIVEESIAEEVKEASKAPQPHKLGRQFTYYWNGFSY